MTEPESDPMTDVTRAVHKTMQMALGDALVFGRADVRMTFENNVFTVTCISPIRSNNTLQVDTK